MGDPVQQYEMRSRLPGGEWDTISHAAEALVRGSGRPATAANIDAAVIALAQANGLQRVTITETVNADTDQRRVVVKGANGRVISDSGWRKRPGEDIQPEPGTGNSIYDCNFIDYRHANGRALQPGDDLRKPQGYTGFAPPLEQVLSDCATCTPIPPVVQELSFITPAPTVREERRGNAGVMQVALPDYPNGGSPTETRAPEALLAYNMPLLMGIMPNQPDPAARGLNRNGTGVQTVVGSLGHSAAYLASVSPLPIPGTNLGLITFPTFMVSGPSSADRVMWSREGGNGAQNMAGGQRYAYESTDVAGRDGRFDGWPFNGNLDNPFGTSRRTMIDGTLVPGLGIQLNSENRVVTAGDTAFGNNQIYYVTGENGAYKPSITMSRVELETGRPNRVTQGEPSRPVPLDHMNSYAMAYFVNQESLQPQIQAAQMGYANAADMAEKRAQAQRAIELLNYQNDLIGISNFNVNADVVGLATRGTPLAAEELLALNPAERIAFQRESILADAATHGITDLDRSAYPSETPIRSASREQVRDGLFTYYMEMATGPKEREFRAIYALEARQDATYDRNDEASVRADVARFVDGLEIVRTMPEQGFAFTNMEGYFHKPRSQFNPVERFEYVPQQRSGLGLRNIEPAMQVIANDPALTGILMAASENGDIAQSWAQFDNLRVQQPRLFGSQRVHWDRARLLEETSERGYRPELIGTTFSREETNGILRDLPAIQEDLVRSAGNPAIIARRQRDLIEMATNNDNFAVGKGAPAMQMLYSLAKEPDNRTLLAIEAQIRANNPAEVAEQQIETLRQGVEFAKDQVTRDMLGITSDEIAAANSRRSVWAPGVGAAQATGSYTTTQTVEEQVIVGENVQTLFGRFAEKPPAAQAFVRATAGMGADQRSVALLSMTTLPPEQQLALARTAIGPNREVAAIIASSNLNAETKAAVAAAIGTNGALNAENAGFVLNALAMVPEASSAALSAIGSNANASTAVMTALAGNKDVASQLVGVLNDAQRADIATKANLNPNQADLWTSVAPQTVTSTVNTTVEVTRLQLPGDDISNYIAASQDPDLLNRNARMSVAFLQDPQFQGRYMREIGQANPDIIVSSVIQAVSQNPQLANPFKGEMTRLGGGRGGLFGTGIGASSHSAQHQLGDAIADLAYAQSRGDQRGIDRATQRITNVAAAANGGDLAARAAIADLATAMVALETPRGTTVSGASALSTTLTTALAVAQANPNATVINGSPVTGTELITNVSTTIANTDVTNSRDLSNRGQWVVANSTSTAGWIVPWIVVPTGGKDPDELTNGGDPRGCDPCPPPPPPTQPPGPVPPR